MFPFFLSSPRDLHWDFKNILFSGSTAMPLFSMENVLTWITPFLVLQGGVLVKKRMESDRRGRPSVVGWGWGGGWAFCFVYIQGLSFRFLVWQNINWKQFQASLA